MSELSWQTTPRSSGSTLKGSEWKNKKVSLEGDQPQAHISSYQSNLKETNMSYQEGFQLPAASTISNDKKGRVKPHVSKPKNIAQQSANSLGMKANHDNFGSEFPLPPNPPPKPVLDSKRAVISTIDLSRFEEQTSPVQDSRPSWIYDRGSYYPTTLASSVGSSIGTWSRPSSTASSAGSIPDFPLPSAIGALRRGPSVGSPPNNKRGNSIFYSQSANISTIPEELPRPELCSNAHIPSTILPNMMEVNASSNVKQETKLDPRKNTWLNIEFSKLETPKTDDYSVNVVDDFTDAKSSCSTEKNNIRIAMKMNPNLDKKTEVPERTTNEVRREVKHIHDSFEPANFSVPLPREILSRRNNSHGSKGSIATKSSFSNISVQEMSPRTAMPRETSRRNSSGGSKGSIATKSSHSTFYTKKPSSFIEGDDIGKMGIDPSILDEIQKVSTINSGAQKLDKPSPTPSSRKFDRFGTRRRPARLDIEKLHDTESRGSLTSLGELIRRATKLAALIEQGNRPGSCSELDKYSDQVMNYKQLASDDEIPANASRLKHITNINRENASIRSNSVKGIVRERQKRFCGQRFTMYNILISLLVLIISAIVLGTLSILVKNKRGTMSKNNSSAINSCTYSGVNICQNGGFSFLLDSNSCACICTNGFTGRTCTINDTSSVCGTTLLAGNNVTLGSSILRLIKDAQNNFSIPLSANLIVARFHSANLSCVAENALVTFQGKSFREDFSSNNSIDLSSPGNLQSLEVPVASHFPSSSRAMTMIPAVTPTASATILPRAVAELPPAHEPKPMIGSSLYPSNPKLSTQIIPSLLPTSPDALSHRPLPSTVPSPNDLEFIPTETTLDFARVVTLYVMQQTNINIALDVQSVLEKRLNSQKKTLGSVRNITLINSRSKVTVDLMTLSVDLGDGNGVIGGNGTSARPFKNSPGQQRSR